jgi:anti-sigma28 factor (negative regulator of flagellin synthesis)
LRALADLYSQRKLLANLWARGAALQCCFNQKAIDFTIPVYRGLVNAGAIFDPSRLSGVSGQVKFKVTGDPQAETLIRPFGIPRDPHDPLPYLALLMELGSESNYKGNSKIKATPSGSTADVRFSELNTTLATAVQEHASRLQEVGKKKEDAKLKRLKKAIGDAQLAVDSYNRYSISVRGASPEVYRVLKTAEIFEAFETLLKITMPLSGNQEAALQHMRPLERLEDGSNFTAWMSEYVAPEEEMELD